MGFFFRDRRCTGTQKLERRGQKLRTGLALKSRLFWHCLDRNSIAPFSKYKDEKNGKLSAWNTRAITSMALRTFPLAAVVVVVLASCVVGAAAAASAVSHPLYVERHPSDVSTRSLLAAAVGEVPDGVKESVEKDLGFSSSASGGGGGEGVGSDTGNAGSGGGGEGEEGAVCSGPDDGSDACIQSFDLAKLEATPLKTEPFKYMVVEQMVPPTRLKRILEDFPPALLSTALASKKNVEVLQAPSYRTRTRRKWTKQQNILSITTHMSPPPQRFISCRSATCEPRGR